MSPPDVPLSVWLWGAFDPVLVAVAAYLGWRADQFGKVFIAAIAALGISVMSAWLVTIMVLPWVAPVISDVPTIYPVRAVAAFVWAAAAYAARKGARR